MSSPRNGAQSHTNGAAEERDDDLVSFEEDGNDLARDKPRLVMSLDKTFAVGERLRLSNVYDAKIGQYDENEFELLQVIHDDDHILSTGESTLELARIYRNKKSTQLHIEYYPGKDNNKPVKLDDAVAPLARIYHAVNLRLKKGIKEKKYTLVDVDDAKRHFTVCESNTYFGVSVAHFVRAMLHKGELTIEDSMNRRYDVSGITNALPHQSLKLIKHGWQSIFNDWACGYHVIAAAGREIRGELPPDDFQITDEVIAVQAILYDAGKKAKKSEANRSELKQSALNTGQSNSQLRDAPVTQAHFVGDAGGMIEQRDEDDESVSANKPAHVGNLEIPVAGTLGAIDSSCHLLLSDLESALAKNANNEYLKIKVVANTNDEIVLRIHSSDPIPAFKRANLEQIIDDENHACYELRINKHDAKMQPQLGQPLLGIRVNDDGKDKFIDVTHMFGADEIKKINERALKISAAQHSSVQAQIGQPDAGVLSEMKKINQYLSKRAKETSGFLSYMFNDYSGEDYYARRQSWNLILKKFREFSDGKLDLVGLKKIIEGEADKFPAKFLGRSQYRDCLQALLLALPSNQYQMSPALAARVSSYIYIYDEMEMYKRAAKQYGEHYSIFRSNDKIRSDIAREKKLYESHYEMLYTDDKRDFLNVADEHAAEYNNANHLKF